MKWPQLLFILLISNCVVGQSYWSFKERPIVPMPENVININDLLSTSTSTTKSNQKPLQKAPNAGACTDNIDFEWGNFTNWQCYTGLAYTSGGTNLVNWNAPGLPIAGRHQIISAATLPTNDAYGNFPRLCPNGGNFSIQLGNNSVGRQAEKVSCSITIPADQNNFLIEYYYAVVFQDPNHLLEQQPRFQTKVYDANNSSSIINCASYDFTAGSGLPGFKTSSVDNLVLYKPWTAVTINLSCYAGHTIILEFITEDCTKGVHFGYAYVDVSSNCTSLQSSATYCQNTQSLTLTAPSGYKSYNWYNSTFTQLLDTTQTITLTPPPANNTTFNVDLVPYSGFGCRDTAFTVLTVKPLPIASFAADSIICSGIPITFTNQSTISDITSLSALWDFGDGTSSTTTNSTKTYNTVGDYIVKLICTSIYGCSDTITKKIKVVNAPTTTTTNVSVCSNSLPYVWNGKSYNAAGTYTANFINSVGCDSVATLILSVKTPTTSTTNTSLCSNTLPFVWNGKSYNAAGIYTANFTNSVGCDSVVTLILAVKTPTTSTTNASVCSNTLPFVWNGKSCNAAGTYTANYSNSVGCDSIVTLVLSVKTPTTSTTNISVCSNNLPFVWNGINHNSAGTYTANFTNSVGCDSVATLVLAVKTPTTSTTNVSVCSNSLPYVWNGKSYNSAGTYTANFTNSVGCDSIATLVLAMKTPTTSTTNVSVCSNNLPYVWNGKSCNTEGTYTANFTNSVGCDSIATLVLAVKSPTTSTTNASVCSNNLPYIWSEKSYNIAGAYTASFINSVGCDSVATLVLAVKTPTNSTTTAFVCSNNLPFIWNGKNCNAAGTYTANFINSVGCDSVATLILAVKSPTTSTTNISVCSNTLPFIWNGKSYNSAGTYTASFLNSVGCDSVATLILAVKSPTTSTTNASVCSNNLPFVWNGKNYNSAGTYTANFINSVGCDSIATLVLAVKMPTTSTTNASVCSNNLPFVWNGKSYNSAGTYIANFINSVGCDSVATLVLAVKSPTTSTTTASVCSNNLPFIWNGKSYNSVGTYTASFINSVGCDSIATLVLTVKIPTTSTTNASVCFNTLPYVWNGKNYNIAGTYTASFTNSVGCDSIATLVLAVKTPTTSTINVSVCSNNLPFVWNGKSYNAAGTYTASFINSVGCDSIATLVLAVKMPSTSTNNISICSNILPFVWNGISYNAAGTYTANFSNFVGCDSVATLVLAVKSTSTSTSNISICSNNLPYVWNGKSCNAAGTYTANYSNSVGCDSIVTLVLSVKTPTTSTTNVSVCSNNLPYVWNGKSCNAAGTYTANFTNSVGCDSVATLVLAVKTPTTSTTNVSVCSNILSFVWNGKSYNYAGVYTANFTNSVGCDSIATLILAVKSTSNSTTNISICSNNLPYVWNGKSYNSAGTYTASFLNSVGCDSIATLVLSVKTPTTSTISTDVCSSLLPFIWNGKSFNAAGTYTANLINAAGCDSVATLILAVKQSTASVIHVVTCPYTLPYFWNNHSYTTTGVYNVCLVNSIGCDSIATLDFIVKSPLTSTTVDYVCPSALPYFWNKNFYSETGTYTAFFHTVSGCDSVATLKLNVVSTSSSVTKDAVNAAKLPYVWNKMAYTESGTYTSPISFINAVGCDSIATLILKVNLSAAASTIVSVCPSDLPYIWNGTAYYAAGTYTKIMTNVFGDNVVVTLELNLLPVYNISQSISIFTGQIYTINGNNYDQPGEYTDILKTKNGCDSTVITNLSFIKIPNTITPNGDGKNDVFMKDYHVKIYNRNGIKLFDGIDGWDGTYNGKPVAKDTYFYVLIYLSGDIEKSEEGYIMVIR